MTLSFSVVQPGAGALIRGLPEEVLGRPQAGADRRDPGADRADRHLQPQAQGPGRGEARQYLSLPNDPTNLARAIAILRQIGWGTLKPGTDPVRATERDIDANPHQLKLIELEAAQLPRSLDDVDYAFVNGNYALASSLKLTSALALEQIPDYYMNLVAVKTADLNKPFVKDIRDAYQSAQFKTVTQQRFAGFVQPPYQR